MAPKHAQKKAHYSSHLQVSKVAVQQQGERAAAAVWRMAAKSSRAISSNEKLHIDISNMVKER